VELDPESFLACTTLQAVLHSSGQLEESVAVAEVALAMSGRSSWSMARLAVTLADMGKPADADAIYMEMMARARRQYVSPAMLAAGAAGASKECELICHAREALRIHDPGCIYFSKYFPFCARFYEAYPRFRELVLEMGFD
jgi:adenylate cyclase